MYTNDYITYTPSLHYIYIYSCIAYGDSSYTSTQATFMYLSEFSYVTSQSLIEHSSAHYDSDLEIWRRLVQKQVPTEFDYGVKQCKKHAHSLWMWQSLHHEENPMHTSVNVVFPAAPNMRCWANSLASLYLVRLLLPSSSLFSVLFWASDAAILLSRSRLRLCSEVVRTAQCRLTCSHNSEANLLRVID